MQIKRRIWLGNNSAFIEVTEWIVITVFFSDNQSIVAGLSFTVLLITEVTEVKIKTQCLQLLEIQRQAVQHCPLLVAVVMGIRYTIFVYVWMLAP